MSVQQAMNQDIFSFFSYISKEISSFPTRLVEGIKIYFGYNAVYGIRELEQSGNVRICRLNGDDRYKRDYAVYKEKLVKTDLFETNFAKIVEEAAARGKMVWRLQDLGYTPDDFFETDYGKLAGKSGFGYKCIIVAPQPLGKYYHSLSIYKTKFQGDFTPEEMNFLSQLAAVFNLLFSSYLQNLRHQALLKVFDYKITSNDGQTCVMDSHLDSLFKTSGFDRVSDKLFGKTRMKEFVLKYLEDIDNIDSSVLYEKAHELDGETVILRLCVFVPEIDMGFNDSKLVCLTVKKNPSSAFAMAPGSALLDEYGFTARELEVLELIMKNESIEEIAEKLFMAKPTARTHISHIYKKMGVSSRLEVMSKLG